MNSLMNDDDNPSVSLKDGIDLNELRKTDGDGVTFEIQEEQPTQEEALDNKYFDGEDLCQNLYNADDSDSDQDQDDDTTPFERVARKMVDVCPDQDGGILKQILKQGSGLVVPANSVVRVHFNGFLEYADEPYDSSRLRNAPLKFRLGQGEVLEGWDIAIATMKKGELSRYLIKPLYAYGQMGSPPRIPENATVMFEIELLSFVEQAGLDDYFNMTEDEKRNVPFTDVKKIYKSIVEEAKQLFQANQIRMAFPKYKKASNLLEEIRLKNEAEEKEQQKMLLRVYLNMALCCVKQCHSGRAVVYCRKCEEIDQKNAKALYLHGKALHQMSEFQKAKDYLKKAQKLKPSDRDVNDELEKVEKDMKNFKLVERDMYQKMFSRPQGQTEEEKAVENQRIENAEGKSLACSDDFRKMVKEKLQEFKEDKDLMEFPMPSYNFTVGEIECIIDSADGLGLDAKVRGSGQNQQIKVLKRRPEVF